MNKSTVACPFCLPIHSRVDLAGAVFEQEVFTPREGLSFVRGGVSEEVEGRAWPFDSFLQAVFVTRGEVVVGLPDKGDRSFTVGDWFVVSPLHWQARCRFAANTCLLVLECSRELWSGLTSQSSFVDHSKRACFVCAHRQEAFLVGGRCVGDLLEISRQLSVAETDSAARRLAIEAQATRLLVALVEDLSLSAQPRAEPCIRDEGVAAVRAAARFLEKNLDEDHSLASVGRAARLNEFKLKRGFREVYGMTVFGYLRQKRMERARELFDIGEVSVIEVANAVGYANPSHFARAFRALYGVNPKRYAASVNGLFSVAR